MYLAYQIDTEVLNGSTTIFDRNFVNEGELYYNSSGQFFCIDNGTYVFSWTVDKRRETPYSERYAFTLNLGTDPVKYGPKSTYTTRFSSGPSLMAAVVQCRTCGSSHCRVMISMASRYVSVFLLKKQLESKRKTNGQALKFMHCRMSPLLAFIWHLDVCHCHMT